VEVWEILGIRQLAATDEDAEEFTGILLVHRPESRDPLEPVAITAKRSVLAELQEYLARLLRRSRGRRDGSR